MYAVGVELPWSERKPPTFTLLAIAGGFAVATMLSILVIDVPVARAISADEPSPFWDNTLDVLEWLILLPPHKLVLPVTLVVALLTSMVVNRWRALAPALMTIAMVHLATRFVTNWIKDGTGRLRPYEWIKKGVDGSFGHDGGIAFPSGHVVLFASLAIPILYVFPRTRIAAIPLLAITAFVALARIAVNAHWISDTLGSIALITFATWAVSWATRPVTSHA